MPLNTKKEKSESILVCLVAYNNGISQSIEINVAVVDQGFFELLVVVIVRASWLSTTLQI